MSRPVNPYIAGAPLRGERGFFGRQDTLDWVARELRNPATNALVLFGQRRIGKTTLLLQLEHMLPADAFLPIYFDLQDQATRPLGQVLADLADTTAEQADLAPPGPDAFDDQGRFFRQTFLPQLYQVLDQDRRPVFLLDEFDVLHQAAESELADTAAAKTLFRFLRRAMTEDPRLAFVFVVGRRAEDLSLDFTATFKSSLVREIWVLDWESAEMLVRQAEANGTLRFTDQAVARILSLTRCHPYLTQLICQRLWERAYAGNSTALPRVDVLEVEAAIPDTLEVGDQALVWLWNGLSPAEKIYAAALAEAADEGETIAEDRVIRVLTDHAARLRTREVEMAPRVLVKRRVLEVAGEREYRFAVELFRRWVRQNKPLRDVKEELDQVEPVAEQFFGIGQRYFSQRRWQDAVDFFRRALERNPHHFRARLHLGEALLELGQTDEAVTELERAYELDRDEAGLPLARSLVAQAKAREVEGDQDGALAACERALKISPNERAAHEMLAAIWIRQGDVAMEQDDLEKALGAYREAGSAEKIAQVEAEMELARLFAHGVGALERGAWEQAQQAFAELVHRRPDYRRDGQMAARLLEQAVLQRSRTVPLQTYGQLLAIAIAAALLTLLGGSWVANIYYFQPGEVTRQAQATTQAIDLATAAHQTAVAQAADATAGAQKLFATVTAEAQALNVAATANAQALDATATANARALDTTATVQAETLRCQDVGQYALAVVREPILVPTAGTDYVAGASIPDMLTATWVVTNTGACPWEGIELQPLVGEETVEPMLQRDGKQVELGEPVEVVLTFPSRDAGTKIDKEWIVVVNGLCLCDQPHLRLAVEGWIVVTTPTATPVPLTPIPPPETIEPGPKPSPEPTKPIPPPG